MRSHWHFVNISLQLHLKLVSELLCVFSDSFFGISLGPCAVIAKIYYLAFLFKFFLTVKFLNFGRTF